MSHEDEFIKFQEESLRQTEVLKVIFSVVIIVCLIAGGLYIKKRDGDNVIIRVPVSASSGEQWQCEAENRDVLDIKEDRVEGNKYCVYLTPKTDGNAKLVFLKTVKDGSKQIEKRVYYYRVDDSGNLIFSKMVRSECKDA